MKMLLKCLNVHDDNGVYTSIMENMCYIYVRSHEYYMALLFAHYYYFGAVVMFHGMRKKRISYGTPNMGEVNI